MADKPTQGTVVSFGNTPQAKDDNLTGLGTEDSSGVIYLNVMANDLAGNAKSLWATDDGISEGGSRPVDLLTQDAVNAQETSKLGAKIWITGDGKVAYQLTAAMIASFQSTSVGQTVTDSFTYAIQMGNNGTLSWAQVNVVLAGVNDIPVVQSVSISAVEDGPAVTGAFIGDDIDSDDTPTSLTYNIVTPPSAGTLTKSGTSFTFNPGTSLQELAVGETKALTFTYTATDKHGATSAPATGTITVTGVNDAPVITTAVTSGSLKEDTTLTASGQMTATDVDNGATQAWSALGTGTYGSMSVDGTGKWTYTLNNGTNGAAGVVQSLNAGQSVTDTFTIRVDDSKGGTADKVVTLTIAGTNDVPVVQGVSIAAVEDGPAVTGAFIGDDIDGDDTPASLAYNIVTAPVAGTLTKSGTSFTFNPGSSLQELAVGETKALTFTYTATDKHGATSAPATGTITMTGVNDAPVINTAVTTGSLKEDTTLTASGQMTATDVDNGATQAWSALGTGTYGSMAVDGTGKWTYTLNNGTNGNAGTVQSLAAGQSVTDTITIRVDDSKGGTADKVVTLTIAGTNDAPVITSTAAAATGSAQEDTTLSASGQLTAVDIDTGATQAWSVVGSNAGTYGSIAVDGTGKWTYTLNNGTNGTAGPVQSLAAGQSAVENFTIRVADGQGGSAEQVVSVTVTGTNDAAVISSDAKTLTETNAAQSTGGTLTVADIDSPQTFQAQSSVAGTYGTFTLASNGAWTYAMNGAQDGFEKGKSYVDTFSATSADGTTRADAVTVTIVGTNDAPTLAPGTLTTNEDTSANITLVGDDVDLDNDGSNLVYSATGPANKGTVSVAGTTLTFNPGNDFQSLGAGQTAPAFDVQVTATDKHGATAHNKVTVTVTGLNDPPTIAGGSDASGAVTASPSVAPPHGTPVQQLPVGQLRAGKPAGTRRCEQPQLFVDGNAHRLHGRPGRLCR